MDGVTATSNIKETGKKNHYFTNWATTYSCVPELYFEPENEQQIREILDMTRRERRKVRVIGCGHSPSDICCTPDYMISMKNFNRVINIDKKAHTVTTEAGISIKELNKKLHESGLAISVLGSVSEVSLAGAISTGTHGTGSNFGSLSTFIIDLDVMLASGEIVHITKESDLYWAACVSLGSLGVILRLTFQCEPAFRLHQSQHHAKLSDVLETLSAQREASDHFRFVWFPHTDGTVVWHNSRTKQPKKSSVNWFWDTVIGFHLLQFCYWVSTFVPELLVPWINRIFYKLLFTTKKEVVDDSFNVFAFECLFKQYVNEWSIPVEETAHVLYELKAWIENNGFPAHFPVEVRFVKGDNLLLSPSHGRDSCYINIIMYRPYNNFVPFEIYWRAYEDIMKRAGGRPHWAKDYKVQREEFEKMYPKWNEFCDIRKRLDPEGLFLNANLEKLFGHDVKTS